MERMKRIISLLLCAVMVIGFLPVSVFAAESDDALTASNGTWAKCTNSG